MQGTWFDPWSWNCNPTNSTHSDILHAAAKTQHSQTKKFFKKEEEVGQKMKNFINKCKALRAQTADS